MKNLILSSALLCAVPLAAPITHAQTSGQAPANAPVSEFIRCPTANAVSDIFQSGKAAQAFPNYRESVGARVQRQHPNTFLSAHTKYINWNADRPVGDCQYSNYAGVVFGFFITGISADATDGACDDGSCIFTSYWRREWSESSKADDKQGKEQIYTCMAKSNGKDVPSAACGLRPVEAQ